MNAVLAYYQWLLNRIAIPNPKQYGYQRLFAQLLATPFYSSLQEDTLRIEEALYLRRSFARTFEHGLSEEEKRSYYEALGPVSVFEIMAIMVEKMSYQLAGNKLADPSPAALFLEILDNAGFCFLTDECFEDDPESAQIELASTVRIILERDYDVSGNGGFFPLDVPVTDMRELDLKQQMELYLVEKYDILE